MNILIIDTATNLEYIGVSINGKKAEKAEDIERTHASSLFQNIDETLSEAGGSIHDIEMIATGIGPGSFTGIRIAVTTARMLAQLTGSALMGLYSQDLLAYSADLNDGDYLLTAFDAKKNRVFGAVYLQEGNLLQTAIEPGDYSIEHLLEYIPPKAIIHTTGDGIARFAETIDKSVPQKKHLPELMPKIDPLVKVIEERYKESPGLYRDIGRLTPCYARKSDAEIAKEKKNISGHP